MIASGSLSCAVIGAEPFFSMPPLVPIVPDWEDGSARENSSRTCKRISLRHRHHRLLRAPIHDVTLLSPFARQIRSLELEFVSSDEAQDSSVTISGPLPLFHTLELNAERCLGGPVSLVAPTLPLFKNVANLKNFVVLTSLYLP
jgi:hypothetical protein